MKPPFEPMNRPPIITKEEEIRDLKRLIAKLREQLTKALEEIAEIRKSPK